MPLLNRSLTQYGDPGYSAFVRTTYARLHGWPVSEMQTRPLIGILNTQSEVNRCHAHFGPIVDAVRRGIIAAGGLPLAFPTISLGELFLSPTAMLFRNLLAMDAEEMIRAQPLDGVVLLGGCDKTIPALLMGACSADVPCLVVSGGPMANGHYHGQTLGACSDCRGFWQRFRAGEVDEATLDAIADELTPGPGHCMVMGTASTMSACTEALGLMLPGGSTIPAPHQRRLRHAFASGQTAVALAVDNLRPSRIVTRPALLNAVRLLVAVGGSTNAVIHLLALAGRLDIPLTLDDVQAISAATPVVADVRPTGRYQMEDLDRAGGMPAVLRALGPLIDPEPLTVEGRALGEALRAWPHDDPEQRVISSVAAPVYPTGGLTVLRGSLAPRGAVIKDKAATPGLLQHEGPAIVFTSIDDLEQRIDDPALPVTAHSVLVLQNAGPVGAPGMPEAGSLPLPRKMLATGVRDMVRVSDARMSGTAFGTVVLHVAPESAVGGPLALVRDGDVVRLDVPAGRLDLVVPEEELARRRHAVVSTQPAGPAPGGGYRSLYRAHVLQADEGCDFDFLRGRRSGE
jgi:dihydroxy-acid dehydratase